MERIIGIENGIHIPHNKIHRILAGAGKVEIAQAQVWDLPQKVVESNTHDYILNVLSRRFPDGSNAIPQTPNLNMDPIPVPDINF